MRGKLVYKIFIWFSCIMILGFLILSLLMGQRFATDIAQNRHAYEEELMGKRADEINEKLGQISSLFSSAYLLDGNNNSLVEEISRPSDMVRDDVVVDYLERLVATSPYVQDLVLVDLRTGKISAVSKRMFTRFDQEYDWLGDEFVKEVAGTFGITIQNKQSAQGSSRSDLVYTFGHSIQASDAPYAEAQNAVLLANVPVDNLFTPLDLDERDDMGDFYVVNSKQEIFYQELAYDQPIHTRQENIDEMPGTVQTRLVSWSELSCIKVTDTDAILRSSLQSALRTNFPILAVILIICLAICAVTARVFSSRVGQIVNHMALLETGDFGTPIQVKKNDELAVIESGLNQMTLRLQEHIEREYIANIAINEAKVRSLQLQINPHFMFNTLETIRSSATVEHADKSARLITLLGQLYRQNLRNPDIISVREELQYLETYIALMELSKGADIECSIDISPRIGEVLIPKLSLQPIVENSLMHGFEGKLETALISITAKEIDAKGKDNANGNAKDIAIDISDNGKGIDPNALEQLKQKLEIPQPDDNLYHIGLINVNHRLKLLFGETYGIELLNSHDGGLCVRVIIPKGEK